MKKIIFILLFINSILILDAQAARGKSIQGSIGLGGILKSLIVPKTLPIGSLTSSYGYEVWDLSSISKSLGGANRVNFCTATMSLETNSSALIGMDFGGEVGSLQTIGLCDDDPNNIGGEQLTISLSYDAGTGVKSIPITATFGYSLDMKGFLDTMENYFRSPFPETKRTPDERLRRMYLHTLKYLAKTSASDVLTLPQRVLLKTFFLPVVFMKGANDVAKYFTLEDKEIDLLKKLKTDSHAIASGFSNFPSEPLDNIFHDPRFFDCAKGEDCEEIYVDFIKFKEALDKAIVNGGYCHSISISAGLKVDLSFKLSKSFNWGMGFGYSTANIDKIYQSNLPLAVLAEERFSKHKFVAKSESCKNVEDDNAKNFGRLLVLMGHGKK